MLVYCFVLVSQKFGRATTKNIFSTQNFPISKMSSNNGSKKSEEFASNQEEELGKQGEKQFHSETLTENRENRDYSNFPMEIER